MITTTFSYVDDLGMPYAYRTDPATLVNVKVGDVIHIDGLFGGRHVSFDMAVESVASDEYGVYLGGMYDDPMSEYRWEFQASAITCVITLVDTGDLSIGALVAYLGSQVAAHGVARIARLCTCDRGDYSPDGAYVLHTNQYELTHVERADFRTL